MPFPVRYYCPRCERIHTLQRSGYLADKSVTPYPLEGWTYADVDGEFESADGVRIVCGEAEGNSDDDADAEGGTDGEGGADEGGGTDGEGCGEPFYLNFVRFEDGEEVEPEPESERVELAPPGPRGPQSPGLR